MDFAKIWSNFVRNEAKITPFVLERVVKAPLLFRENKSRPFLRFFRVFWVRVLCMGILMNFGLFKRRKAPDPVYPKYRGTLTPHLDAFSSYKEAIFAVFYPPKGLNIDRVHLKLHVI